MYHPNQSNTNFRFKPLTSLVLFALFNLGQVAMAEPLAANNTVDATLETITVKGKKPVGHVKGGKDGVYEDNLSSSYKNKQDLDTFRGTSAADVLQGITGVYSGDARNSGAIDPNVRGIQGQGRVPVTVDGTQQGITVYRGYAGANNRNYIDPLLISSIRVEKGPSLTRGMENSIGGGIAIKTIGVEDVVKPGQTFGLDIRMEAGSNHTDERAINLNNYVGKTWDHSMDPYLKHYPPTKNWQGNIMPPTGKPIMLTAVKPKQSKLSSFGHDQAYRIAGAMTTDKLDLLAAYAYRTRGNYFAGKNGMLNYNSNLSVVTKLFGEGKEVTNTSNETHSVLLKSTIRPTENSAVDLMFNHMDSDYGDIMPSRVRGTTLYPPPDPHTSHPHGPNMLNALQLVPQWALSNMQLNTYAINYHWQPDNPWIDLKSGIWASHAHLHTHNSGSFPLGCGNTWAGICKNGDEIVSHSAYNSKDKRYGFYLSNRMTLTDQLALTLSANAQQQKLSSPDDWWRTERGDSLRMMPQAGTRNEYKLDFNFDWQPSDRLTLSAGARYNSYWSKDDGLQALFDSDSPNKDFYQQGLTHAPLGWRVSFTGGVDPQGNPYDKNNKGHVDWLFDESGKLHAQNNPFLNGTAEKNGWQYDDVNLILPGEHKLDSNRRLDNNASYDTPPLNNNVHKKRAHAWSPVLSASYKLTDHARIYARYTQATHMPSLFTTSFGFSGYSPLNTNFKPEKATNIEIGYAHDLRSLFASPPDKADVKLSWYRNNIKNAIDRNLDFSFTQLDKWQTSGIELQARYDNGRFFSELGLARRLTNKVCDEHSAAMRNMAKGFDPKYHTSACVQDGFNVGYTQNMQQPLWTADVTLGGRFFEKKLETGARLHYHSGYKRPSTYDDKSVEPGVFNEPLLWGKVFLVDVYARYNFKNDLSVDVSATNLTNRHYIDPLSRSPMPAPGRTFKISLNKKF